MSYGWGLFQWFYMKGVINNNWSYLFPTILQIDGDLGFHIKRKKLKKEHFPEMLIVNWFFELAVSIKYIHEKKILHRDIKTTNIFITRDGTIKIGDFGISKVLENTFSVAKTVVGTPYYMRYIHICRHSKPFWRGEKRYFVKYNLLPSNIILFWISPEVCESRPYTYKSDIWALGCVIFELCALEVNS